MRWVHLQNNKAGGGVGKQRLTRPESKGTKRHKTRASFTVQYIFYAGTLFFGRKPILEWTRGSIGVIWDVCLHFPLRTDPLPATLHPSEAVTMTIVSGRGHQQLWIKQNNHTGAVSKKNKKTFMTRQHLHKHREALSKKQTWVFLNKHPSQLQTGKKQIWKSTSESW